MNKCLVLFSLMMSACASSPKFTIQKPTDGRSPAQSSGGIISLNSSGSCNRIDADSSAEHGRWLSMYSQPWEESMISTLQAKGVVTDIKMMTDDGTENRMTLDLGQAGVALASNLDSHTYFARYELMTNNDQDSGMMIVSYKVQDKVAGSNTVRKAKSILLFFGVASSKIDTIVCKHAANTSEINNNGCTLIDDKTVLSSSPQPLCFDTTAALNSYQNSF